MCFPEKYKIPPRRTIDKVWQIFQTWGKRSFSCPGTPSGPSHTSPAHDACWRAPLPSHPAPKSMGGRRGAIKSNFRQGAAVAQSTPHVPFSPHFPKPVAGYRGSRKFVFRHENRIPTFTSTSTICRPPIAFFGRAFHFLAVFRRSRMAQPCVLEIQLHNLTWSIRSETPSRTNQPAEQAADTNVISKHENTHARLRSPSNMAGCWPQS